MVPTTCYTLQATFNRINMMMSATATPCTKNGCALQLSYSSFPGWSIWWWGCPGSGRPQRRLPASRTPEPWGDCSSRPSSRSGRRAGGPGGHGTAGRNPSAAWASDRHHRPGAPPPPCYRRTEPEPRTGFHHNWETNIDRGVMQKPLGTHSVSKRGIKRTIRAQYRLNGPIWTSATCFSCHWSSSFALAPGRWQQACPWKWCSRRQGLRWSCRRGRRLCSGAAGPWWCWGCWNGCNGPGCPAVCRWRWSPLTRTDGSSGQWGRAPILVSRWPVKDKGQL